MPPERLPHGLRLLLGFGILTIIVIVLVGYIASTVFYYFSDSWIVPMAVTPTDEKVVALKRIQRKLLETRHLAIELFLNEAKIAGRLTHPNIVQVLDVGEVQGALYLAMEYVHGKDLRRVIKKLQQSKIIMPLAEACHIVREVALSRGLPYDPTYCIRPPTGAPPSTVRRMSLPQCCTQSTCSRSTW